MKAFLRWFLHYGLVAAVVVWAGAVGMMAYHLKDSEWRWAFAVLSVLGFVTIGGIFRIRSYIDRLSDPLRKGQER